MPTKKMPKGSGLRQRALVVGVSDYQSPISKLPAVSSDVREMAKLLGSKHGVFSASGVNVLTDGKATRNRILTSVQAIFSGATEDETVFVYLAGHGTSEGNDYYFLAHDTDINDFAGTGVPLADIKVQFDKCRSQRVFLWLDFCHSGGVLARRPGTDDSIKRAIGVVKGHGKIIVAACTSVNLPTRAPLSDMVCSQTLCFGVCVVRQSPSTVKSQPFRCTSSSTTK